MTNRFQNPDEQFSDGTGTPYAGGTLSFFASGTSTTKLVYSDQALTVSRGSVVTLDSAGRAGSIFLQNIAYKVVLADVNSNTIWTLDPVQTSDFSGVAQFSVNAGNPNGVVAGTAGSGTVPSSVIWDMTNNILYVCTTTGNAASAVWTAVNPAAAATTSITTPQGYLSPLSGTAVITSDTTSTTNISYEPYVGYVVPVYNGTSFINFTFTSGGLLLSIANSAYTANAIFDIFAFSNSGTLTLATGPAWQNASPGSCARGTGAGTTQLSRVNGLWTNAVSISSPRNGNTTYSALAANQGTFLGSIYIDSTASQVTCHRGAGQNRKWGVSNAYNRLPVELRAFDSTASWAYTTATFRASNNLPASYSATAFNQGASAANGVTVFDCLGEETASVDFFQAAEGANPMTIGIGQNGVTNTASFAPSTNMNGASIVQLMNGRASFPPSSGSLGLGVYACVEKGNTSGTFFGTLTNMLLSARWRA